MTRLNFSALDDDEVVEVARTALTTLVGRFEDDEHAQPYAMRALDLLNGSENIAWPGNADRSDASTAERRVLFDTAQWALRTLNERYADSDDEDVATAVTAMCDGYDDLRREVLS